ncbi:MAG TPA: DUF1178 family protein [Methylomirabilota bacterium]|nr:DUF1178 family protein [Methylomirabilota bacterium]
MIRYALSCSHGHRFEAWFRSAADFDGQEDRGLLSCPTCGDVAVSKALMAPSVTTRAAGAEVAPGPEAPSAPTAVATVPPATTTPEVAAMIAKLREIKAALLEKSENVGSRFADEARRIHYGEAPARPVHGEASNEDARALIEEGVEILPLPILPEERN